MIKATIPVLSTSKVGSGFKITATAATPNDINLKNNVTYDLISICSPY